MKKMMMVFVVLFAMVGSSFGNAIIGTPDTSMPGLRAVVVDPDKLIIEYMELSGDGVYALVISGVDGASGSNKQFILDTNYYPADVLKTWLSMLMQARALGEYVKIIHPNPGIGRLKTIQLLEKN